MKDIHCHILYGIDDGSKDLEESIEILKSAVANGYTDIILTPHYRARQHYVCDNNEKLNRYKVLKQEVEKRNINIKLHLGNEITIDEDFFYYLNSKQTMFLANSKYILLELNFSNKSPYLDHIIDRLIRMNCIPIIAHPERYEKYEVKDFEKMIKKGVLLQGNIGSLYGKYGRDAKDKIIEMLEKHMIHFIGSDIHKETQDTYERVFDAFNKIAKITGSKEMTLELFDGNIDKVINNQIVKAYPIVKNKVSLTRLVENLIRV